MKPNRQNLLSLMTERNISIAQVMKALNVSYQTVRCWRSVSGMDISDKNLNYLKLQCK